MEEIEIAPHSEDIYTVFNVSGANDLDISTINFGSNKIVNIDYPLSQVDAELRNKYKAFETYRNSLRQQYFELAKTDANLLVELDSLLDRQPSEAVNNNWSSTVYYSLDDLRTTLAAYRNVCTTIESLYKDEQTGEVDYEALEKSADAALYYSYKDICIPDIEAEIEYRETASTGEPETVEQEFVWEVYGLNDLLSEQKSLDERIRSYVAQGYDGTWDESRYIDKDEFNAHHERYLFLVEKANELKDIIAKKEAQHAELLAQRDEIAEQMKHLAKLASLDSHVDNGVLQQEDLESILAEDGATDILTEYDPATFVYFTEEEVAAIKELYRESDYTNDNYLVTEYDDVVSQAVIQNELYEAAAEQLYIESRPQHECTVSADDLFSMKEFDSLRGQLQIGDFVWLGIAETDSDTGRETTLKQKFRVMTLEFSGLKTSPSFDITFSTMIQTQNGRTDLEELLDSAISSSVNSMSVGVTSKSTQAAVALSASLIKPYIEAINARIDNLQVQNATIQDLKATSALIEELTVFDLMAGNITADKSITLTNREGYGSIIIENSQMKFCDENDDIRVLIGRGNDGGYIVNIYGEADSEGNQPLLWGSGGLQAAAVSDGLINNGMLDSNAVTTEKVAWSGISESVDEDGRPVFGADKISINGERLNEQWDALLAEVSSLDIQASSQVFLEFSDNVYLPSTITLTPVLHVLSELDNIQWVYRLQNTATWVTITSTTPSETAPYIGNEKVLTVPSGCTLFTDSIAQIAFRASYIENEETVASDIVTLTRLRGGEGGESTYSVVLSNEAQTVATDASYHPISGGSHDCDVTVYKGIGTLIPTSSSSPAEGYYYVSATCSESSVSLDTTTTPGTIAITFNSSIAISPNFNVTVEITVGGLADTITKEISFGASSTGISVTSVVRYYKLQNASDPAPSKPTTATPAGWTTTEPAYEMGKKLYFCDKAVFSDNTFEYSDVSLSSSYTGLTNYADADYRYSNAYTVNGNIWTFTATIMHAGIDISATEPSGHFLWYKKTQSGNVLLGTGRTISVDASTFGMGGAVVGVWTDEP